MEAANEELAKRGIKIQKFTPGLEEDASQLNKEERYKVRPALRMGFQAPFLHILSGFWIIIFWKAFAFDLPIAVMIGYIWACLLFVFITHILLTTKLTAYGHIGEVHAADRGMMWVAMDTTQETPHLAGMVGISPLSPTIAELVRYMVRSPYQGMGIGRGLLDTALEFAVDEGYEAVEAETWDVSVEFKVFPMYAKRGFHRHHTSWGPSVYMPMYKSEILMKDLI